MPSYNEEEALPIFYKEVIKIEKDLSNTELEFIFIDDGSKDKILNVLRELNKKDTRVRYISFSRNFGKEAAMYAGLEASTGDYVAILDVDLQDPPSLLPEMLRIVMEEDYECVGTRRINRKGEPLIRSLFARWFYKILNKISNIDIADGARDFQLMSRKVVNAILSMDEYNRFFKGISGWIGFKRKWLEYENTERSARETKWSFWKLFVYAMDGITSFSTAPLVASSVMGIFFCMIAFIFIAIIIARTLIFGDPTAGWPSIVCIILLTSGVQLLSIGILGQYIAKTYLETKNRPLYLIQERSDKTHNNM